ncbi:hypothetical protein Taro_035428 [Colocasia esculenta]|uniref:Uncharacterized protein n=1 Tax=Colocasia esculenta TaxID=4460 RepID=A0A843W0G1_COLES|nr:hypothetical protein [Colocasia esculenta]
MGNCLADNKGLVHPALQPFQPEGTAPAGRTSLIKVRMSAKEFEELVRRAESPKCDTGAVVGILILEGVRRGMWESVGVCDAAGEGGGGGGDRGNATRGVAALETIHEHED